MPIRLNNQMHKNGGFSNFNQRALQKIRYANRIVWQRQVTLKNLLNAQGSGSNYYDIAPQSGSRVYGTYTVVSGHRYFVRAGASILTTDWTGTPYVTTRVGGTAITSISGSGASGTNNAIITPSSTSCEWRMDWNLPGGGTVGGNYWTYTYLYMIVDLTEIEEALGRTFTASEFWNYIGGQVFYGNKDVIPE